MASKFRSWAASAHICIEDRIDATATGTWTHSGQDALLNVWIEGDDCCANLSLPLPSGSHQAAKAVQAFLANQISDFSQPGGVIRSGLDDDTFARLGAAGWEESGRPLVFDPIPWREFITDQLCQEHDGVEIAALGVVREDRLLLLRQPESSWAGRRERFGISCTARALSPGALSRSIAAPGKDLADLMSRTAKHACHPWKRPERFSEYSVVTLAPFALTQLLATLGNRVDSLGCIVGGPHVSFPARFPLPLPMVEVIRIPQGQAEPAGQRVVFLDEIRESDETFVLIFTTEKGEGGLIRVSLSGLALALASPMRRCNPVVSTRLGDLDCHAPPIVIQAG